MKNMDPNRLEVFKDRKPQPVGTLINYDGIIATVVKDTGGPSLVVAIKDEEGIEEWEWLCDGKMCRVMKDINDIVDHSLRPLAFPPELLELIESAPCTCPNPDPGDYPCDPKSTTCYRNQMKVVLSRMKTNAIL